MKREGINSWRISINVNDGERLKEKRRDGEMKVRWNRGWKKDKMRYRIRGVKMKRGVGKREEKKRRILKC